MSNDQVGRNASPCTFLVIFDFNRTVYDPETDALVFGVRHVLARLKSIGACVALLSRREGNRANLLESLGVAEFFAHVEFVADKDTEVLLSIMRWFDLPPERVYVVGDYLHEEIRFGNMCGMRTVWFRAGRFANLRPEIEYDVAWREILDMTQLLELLPAH